MPTSVNLQTALRFEEVAALLEAQNGNPERARMYQRAAEALRRSPRSVRQILDTEGEAGLARVPGIGEALARQIRTTLSSGRLPILERLRGETDPVAMLASVPGIGRKIAHRLHHDLGIDTFEELEAAANDGRLELLAGFGQKKVSSVADSLQGRTGRAGVSSSSIPPVEEVLSVDAEYREKAAANALPKIAPRQFNESNQASLPVLHTRRGDREYMAVFSNTARAHKLERTRDWVIVYADQGAEELQYTVVTGREGALAGKRVVRGRDAECRAYYESHQPVAV
ncbi:MAG: helix-hairpin-helix domain-containing protein [Bryobacterales bacterium]